jgi:23S rRNA (guanine745-N1)-methyltransferase
MTPYYYKTGKKEQERLANLENLKTEAEFEILTYKIERN